LSLQAGIYVGAKRIENVLYWLGPDFQAKHQIFSEFTRAVPLHVPVGSGRLLWDPAVVLKTDLQLASVEARFRTQLLAECIDIIKRYG
jgi:hypothetical protein